MLETTEEWVRPDQKPILREDTKYVFHASLGARTIERITTLTALDSEVDFIDNKEGVIGMRLARQLEHPSLQPEKFADASGKVTDVAKMDTAGVHGHYISSEGKEGDAVWGTRGKWTMLHGDVNGAPVTIAILDHPKNWGYPTYWHARGYGLFAANPLGQKALTEGKAEATNYKLAPHTSTTFRHEVVILDGTATPAGHPEVLQLVHAMTARRIAVAAVALALCAASHQGAAQQQRRRHERRAEHALRRRARGGVAPAVRRALVRRMAWARL